MFRKLFDWTGLFGFLQQSFDLSLNVTKQRKPIGGNLFYVSSWEIENYLDHPPLNLFQCTISYFRNKKWIQFRHMANPWG